MTDGDGSTYRRFVDSLEQRDLLMVFATLGVVYVLFSVLVFNQGIGSVVSTLRLVTFLGLVYALTALALNLQWGYTGLFNIGVAGFMAVGVYTMGMVVRAPDASPPGLGLPLPVGILLGMVMAALVGLVAALPALRLRADYLAIVTLGLSEIIRFTLQSSTFNEFLIETFGIGTGGGSGMGMPQNPVRQIFYVDGSAGAGLTPIGEAVFAVTDEGTVLGMEYSISQQAIIEWSYVLVLAVFLILFYLLLDRIARSPFGRVLKAIREDEVVADSLGKNVRLFKIKVFMLGCALMGLAGILWQGSQGFVSPTPQFMPLLTFYVFIAVIIGGSGSNTGSILGGIVFAGILFEAPRRIGAGIRGQIEGVSSPSAFADALATLDPLVILAYTTDNIAPLQFMLLGLVLIFLMHRRPDGLLGHRMEAASAVDLSARRQPPAKNGGENDE